MSAGGLLRIADSEQPRSETLQILGIWIQFVSEMNSNEILREQTLGPPVGLNERRLPKGGAICVEDGTRRFLPVGLTAARFT